jgi:hypothetical protein
MKTEIIGSFIPRAIQLFASITATILFVLNHSSSGITNQHTIPKIVIAAKMTHE